MKRVCKQPDAFNLNARVYALWLEGVDTISMSKALQVGEDECERALHRQLDLKRALRDSLRMTKA